MTEKISGGAFKQMVAFGAACITREKQAINDLNVFPVPDGDTGTNMSLTIQTAAAELKKCEPATVGEAAKITASALLRGARGNSGVILSLLFRGLSKSAKGLEEMDGVQLAAAMSEGVTTAYGAVMKPAEGTVLTVSRLAAARAEEAAQEQNCAEYVLAEAIATGYETLAETTEMNPVLKKAGVVDAGGKGYLIILEGMLSSLRGEPMPEVEEEPEHDKADFAAIGDEDITFAFDTVFIVRKNDPNVDLAPFRAYLDSIGDSLVIGEDDESFKVHVHTDTPGEALTAAQRYGTLELAKIENMRTQAADLAAGRKAQSTDDLDAIEAELEQAEQAEVPAEKRYGFLAVCAGDGLAAAFRDLGVDRVVSGGQTMNPSTEAILREVNHTPSEIVFVLPNNKNIVMAAQQCVGLTEKQVIVVPTHSIPQGISAMMSVDTAEEDPQAILAAMTEAAAAVTTAQITYAARNSDFDGFAINEGDYLALLDGKLFGTERDITSLLTRLAALAAERGTSLHSRQELERLQAQMHTDRAGREALLERFRRSNEEAGREMDIHRQKAEELRTQCGRLKEQLASLATEKLELERRRTQQNQEMQRCNEEVLHTEREVARLEQQKNAAAMEEKNILDKLWERYELSHSEAQSQRMELESIPKATRRIGELNREIKSLGTPNIGAIEEFDRVNTRYTYLSEQRTDVEKAKEELTGVIDEITRQMTEIFAQQFRLLNESFQETFLELFGGGKARLELEDENDILGCGIEIKVQPPGKQLKTITLLSGGEKAFVAIALYFAIMKVHPTPFCVMDEIEAALDEANVVRYARYMRRIAGKTQFIVITHRRGTMEEADVLYGVTMQERGVSRILTINLNDMAKELKIK